MDKWISIPLGIYFLSLGILSVTDVHVEWSKPIIGYSALVVGVVCVFRTITGWNH